MSSIDGEAPIATGGQRPNGGIADTVEGRRLDTSSELDPGPWKQWGAYLSERAWGSVREDYSADGDAWASFPHDHARSRAYRWSEDGMAGWSDLGQRLCLSLALWNGRDPIIKERMFGLSNTEGNHGEDVKEHWWYVDATPTHSWMSWRYHYPQRAFPYEQLIEENARRSVTEPEFELLDTNAFDDDRFWAVTVDFAKAGPDDVCMRIRVHNHGPQADTIHVLPTLWFRNTWSWDIGGDRPEIRLDDTDEGNASVIAAHQELPLMRMTVDPPAPWLVCDNETNAVRLFGEEPLPDTYPKDAINDTVVGGLGDPGLTCPESRGTKAATHHELRVEAGATAEIRVRLRPASVGMAAGPSVTAPTSTAMHDEFDATIAARRADADEFHDALAPSDATRDDRLVLRQACAGMVWGQQFFHINIGRWLAGDPTMPTPPAARLTGRNSRWWHLNSADVMSMPDAWEFPWFASWDLGFHAVALAHLDPHFAKHQLVLLCREWFMHPNGQIPAYEWNYGDVNPPVHAWAARRVFEIDGSRDHEFLARVFHKLLINFTWWINRTDSEGNNVFEGGFLGLDNIGPFDRSAPVPIPGVLEQSDATAWMAAYCLEMLQIALVLAEHDASYEDVATKFLEHFAYIATAMNDAGMWNEEDGFYYDVVRSNERGIVQLRIRSVVGLIPMFAVAVIRPEVFRALPDFSARVDWFIEHQPQYGKPIGHLRSGRRSETEPLLLSIASPHRLERMLTTVLDPDEMLSPHGLRALSKFHRDHPFVLSDGASENCVDYEPGESSSRLFGGNSNWRGPVWMPINALAVEALHRWSNGLPDFRVPHPNHEAGVPSTLPEIADDLTDRLWSIFRRDANGRRAVFGDRPRLQDDPAWRDLIVFHEYFHGDDGSGRGASHQTGWTGMIIDLLLTKAHRT